MRVIGLTGGISSGKSSVARLLRELGAEVVDADRVAREVVEPGQPALAEIVRVFSPAVLDETGALDRKRLGALIFADPERRQELNAIIHPRIAVATQAQLAALASRGVPVAIYEAALLVENGAHRALDGLIVVAAGEDIQIARTVLRDGLTPTEAKARLRAQASLRDKIAVADYVIDNNGSEEALRRQTAAVWAKLLAGGPKRP